MKAEVTERVFERANKQWGWELEVNAEISVCCERHYLAISSAKRVARLWANKLDLTITKTVVD